MQLAMFNGLKHYEFLQRRDLAAEDKTIARKQQGGRTKPEGIRIVRVTGISKEAKNVVVCKVGVDVVKY